MALVYKCKACRHPLATCQNTLPHQVLVGVVVVVVVVLIVVVVGCVAVITGVIVMIVLLLLLSLFVDVVVINTLPHLTLVSLLVVRLARS